MYFIYSLTFSLHPKKDYVRTLLYIINNVMNTHFCKVGKIKTNLKKLISLAEFEKIVSNFVDDVNKIDFSEDLKASI